MRYFLITCIILFIRPLYAQISPKFTGEAENFTAELSAFMSQNENEDALNAMNLFLPEWETAFTGAEKEKIASYCVSLAEKNARPYPQFANFLNALLKVKNSNDQANFSAWMEGLENLLTASTLQTINNFLGFTISFTDEGILYSSPSVKWKLTNDDYIFRTSPAPFVEIRGKTNLICYSGRDSIIISGTSGSFYPSESLWRGKEGTVTWERAGFSSNEVFAELHNYAVNVSRPEYNADSVIFTNKNYFDESIAGTLTDRVMHNNTPGDADFPQFNTYQKDFTVRDLYTDIDYKGGLAMQGAKLIGRGDRFNQAEIGIYRNDTLLLTARSVYFAFKQARIDAPNAEITIRLKQDSIYHPGVSLSYILKDRALTLASTDNFTSQSPYFSSYHNIDMTFGQLTWKMDEPYMRFSALTGSTRGDASFESVNYFNNERYSAMQGIDEVHPLISIRSFGRNMKSDLFLAEDFANYLRKPVAQVKQLLMRMAVMGFIYYDTESETATIKQRLNDYLAASVDLTDYDAISFPSSAEAPGENAVLDLRTYDLKINGIPSIILSEDRNVSIYPKGASILMKKNRDIYFDGLVEAGLFMFMGNNFFFSYDTFKIDMVKIDSMRISYATGERNSYGFDRIESIKNLIRDFSGTLYINKPDNKSGRELSAGYPVFTSSSDGFVYYDDIRNGAYPSDRFFFRVNPFTMDSLLSFNYKSVRLEGGLVSAGILPETDEVLSLNNDNSLGFTSHFTPDTGLPVYQGKGVFYNEITLDSRGLTGKGTLGYLSSSSQSDEIVFYPDSAAFIAESFKIDERTTGTEYPEVNSAGNPVTWYPYSDEMSVPEGNEPFKMFGGQADLRGDMLLTPAGLTGRGRIKMEGAELEGGVYSYTSHEIIADTVDFYLRSLHTEGFTVMAENMKAQVDFNTQTGTFASNDEFTLVSFPENRYVSYLDNFIWQKENKLLVMGTRSEGSEDNSELTGARYFSLDPDQDSLSFVSPLAYYDYDSTVLRATAVKYIDVADARIYPYMEELVVNPDGRLRKITNSGIIAGRDNEYFNLFNASLSITARNSYNGSADYEYIDENDNPQLLHFRDISVNDDMISAGSGEIITEDHFTLSPAFSFQGKFYMQADRPYLTFDGGARIMNTCENINPGWLYFRGEINPEEVLIPVDEEPRDIDRNQLYSGLYIYYDSLHVYPAFLSFKKFHSDKPVASASGFLAYNPENHQYLIAGEDKIHDTGKAGNMVTLDTETCNLYAEGSIDPGGDLGQVTITAQGSALHKPVDGSTELSLMLGMDFYITEDVTKMIGAQMDSVPGLEATDLTSPARVKNLTGMLGQEQYEKYMAELSLFGEVKQMPEALRHTLNFSELRLIWDDEANSWKSVGKTGISNIADISVNKRMNGLFELQIRRSGDICDIYLEADRRTWYYFGYTRGVMQIHSSSQAVLERIKNLKNRDRRMRIKTGDSYIYMVSTDAKKNTFYRRYQDEMDRQSGFNLEE